MNIYYEPAYLQHHGVKGMKWGRRRYQNKDGSLTPAGKAREEKKQAKYTKKLTKKYAWAGKNAGAAKYYRDKGDELTEIGERVARKAESAARDQAGKGNIARSKALQVSANASRNAAAKARKDYDDRAAGYEYAAKRANEKASKYATKKRVDLGKNEVDKILRDNKKRGYELAKQEHQDRNNAALREAMGDTVYGIYDMTRDKRN